MADKINRTPDSLTSRGTKAQKAALARLKGQTYKGKGPGVSRAVNLAKSRARAAKKLNVQKLRRKFSNLPSFGEFIQSNERSVQRKLLDPFTSAPQRIGNSLYFDSGVAGLLSPFQNALYTMEGLRAFDSNFNREDRDLDEEIDDEEEEEDCECEEPLYDYSKIFADEPIQVDEIPSTESSFEEYQRELFGRLDRIIKYLTAPEGVPEKTALVRQTVRNTPQIVIPEEDDGGLSRFVALLSAGIAGIVIPRISDFFNGNGIGNVNGALITGAEIGVAAFAGQQLAGLRRDIRRNNARNAMRDARQAARNNRTRANTTRLRNSPSRGRGPRALRNASRATRRVTGNVARTAGRFGRGMSSVFRTLSRAARVGGILSALAIPIIEWIEGSERLRDLSEAYDNGTFRPELSPEARERAHAVAESRIVVEGIADTIGILGGAAIGGIMGAGVFSLLTGAAGAWVGEQIANWFNEHHAEGVAAAIVDARRGEQFNRFIQDLANFNLADFVEDAARASGPAGMIAAAPLLTTLRGLELVNEAASGVVRQVITQEPSVATTTATANSPPQGSPSAPPNSVARGLNTSTRRDRPRTTVVVRTNTQVNNNLLVTRVGQR